MDNSAADLESRKKRIKRMKRTIVISVLILILIPIILCSILFIKVIDLEKQVNNLILTYRTANAEEKKSGQQSETSGEDENIMEEPTSKGDFLNENEDGHELISQTAAEEKPADVSKKVYLTFDDGPSRNTDEILEILDRYQVKATFFVVQKTDEESIRRYKEIVNRGHTLAMHSVTHIYAQIYGNIEAYKEDVNQIQNFLFQVTGQKPMIYRFPGGSSTSQSRIRIGDCVNYLSKVGITYFDWNVASGDAASGGLSTEAIVQNVISGIEQCEDAVVLMHDANDKNTTVQALPGIIERVIKMGAKVLPITEKTTPVQHRISK